MEPPADGVRHTDTAAHLEARNAADAYTVGRVGQTVSKYLSKSKARVYAVDTRASGGVTKQE